MTDTEPALPWRRAVVYRLQAWAAWGFFFLVRLLPLHAASALGGRVGRAIGPLAAVTRQARRNLERAFPEKTAADIDTIISGMWENLGRTLFEFPQLDRFRFNESGAEVEIRGLENIDLIRDDGEPGLIVSAHMANWEMSAVGAGLFGLRLHVIYRAPNNPYTAGLFRRRHAHQGELLTKGAKGARRAMKLLAQREHIAFLVDQKMNDGIPVPFFGRDAMTAPALAQLALRFRCPLLPVRVERLQGCRFLVTVFPPMELPDSGDKAGDVLDVMTRVNETLEGWIRERPEQWLWLHNRWPD